VDESPFRGPGPLPPAPPPTPAEIERNQQRTKKQNRVAHWFIAAWVLLFGSCVAASWDSGGCRLLRGDPTVPVYGP
jgi:hypothetical protein